MGGRMEGEGLEGRGLRAGAPQQVTFVELFFDLVFVFAVTQVTVLLAYDLTPGGILRAVLLFWLIWWAWTQFTWTLNPADTTHPTVRALTLVATGIAFVMAASVPNAFKDGALWFAVPYVAVRLLGLGLQVRVDLERPDVDRSGITRWAIASLTGLLAVLVGAVAPPELRPWIWLLAVVLDLGAATVAGRRATWDLNAAHISERHGLFVIIALGESLIVAGAAAAEAERTPALIAAALASIVAACLLWWTYFGWLKDAAEHRFAAVGPSRIGQAARDAFSLAHFPLVCGIIAFSVAVKEITGHPDEPAGAAYVAALGVGTALFVGFSAVTWWRLSRRWLLARFAILGLMAVGLVIVAPMAPVWPVAVVGLALLAIVLVEAVRPPAGHPTPAAAAHPH